MLTALGSLRRSRAGRLSPLTTAALLVPVLALLIGAFFYPLFRLLATSVWDPKFTLTHYQRLFAEPFYVAILIRTLRIALMVSLCTLILGYPVAIVMARLTGWRASAVVACVLVPLWTSVLVRSYAWVVLLQRNGLINGWLRSIGLIDQPLHLIYTEGAVLLAMTHVLLPFMILPVYATLRNIPSDLPRAAANLGAGSWAAFRFVTLPLSLPGMFAGVLMVFILSLGFYVTPALVGGPQTLMIPTLIGEQMTALLNWPFASALAVFLLAITLALAATFRRILKLDLTSAHGG